MTDFLLNPWLVFGSLWLSLAALVAFYVWPHFVAPMSDDTFSDYGDFLLALGDLTSPRHASDR